MTVVRGLMLTVSVGLPLLAEAAEITIQGTAPDVLAFHATAAGCRAKSVAFDGVMRAVETDSGVFAVRIDVGRSGPYIDNAFGGMGHAVVNLSNLERLPAPSTDARGRIAGMPPRTPPWAATRCEILAHIIREAHWTGARQIEGLIDAHVAGIAAQNDVREGFGQRIRAISSFNHYSGGGESRRLSYIQMSFEGGVNERLSFDSEGRLQLAYYSRGNARYAPR